MCFSFGGEGLANSTFVLVLDLNPLPAGHAADSRHPLCCEISSPAIGRGAVRVGLGQPSPRLEKQIAVRTRLFC